MLYGKYQFFCHLETEAILPPYKGSTFRGVFGWALRSVVCALRRQECEECLLRERCIYALVFETPKATAGQGYSRIVAPPHPFVIEPPLLTETRFPRDSSFDFSLLLFGEANRNLPYFIYAFEQMGKMGMGKKVNGSSKALCQAQGKSVPPWLLRELEKRVVFPHGPDEKHNSRA